MEMNDVEALRLIERHGGRVYQLAFRITGVPEDAAAVTEETLRAAAQEIQAGTGEPALGSWTRRTVATMAYRRLGRRQNSAVSLSSVMPSLDADGRHFAPLTDWSNRIDEQALQGGLRGLVAEAIDALPADHRTALILHDVEGMSKPDIAEVVGVGMSEVTSLVHRARLFVRQRLSEYFDPHSLCVTQIKEA